MNKRKRKARRKRWLKKRIKTQARMKRKERFNKAFRDHFVRKGILKD